MSVQGLEARALEEMKALEQGYDHPDKFIFLLFSSFKNKEEKQETYTSLVVLYISL